MMFFGAEPHSRAFGRAGCRGGGGGGGGGSEKSKVCSALCGSVRSMRPERCNKANSSAAWMPMTAAIAPPRSRAPMSLRYATDVQRRWPPRVAQPKRHCATGRFGCGIFTPGPRTDGRWTAAGRRRGWLCRPCWRFPVVSPDPSLQNLASQCSSSPCVPPENVALETSVGTRGSKS